jgi:hypothetical protein
MCFSSLTQYADIVKHPHKTHVRVLEVECKPAGRNLMGTVQSGYLKISGPLLESTHIAAFYPSTRSTTKNEKLAAFSWPDEFAPDTQVFLGPQNVSFPSKSVVFLRCVSFTINPMGNKQKVASLVLVHSDRVAYTFERIGRLIHDKVEEADAFYHDAKGTTITIV